MGGSKQTQTTSSKNDPWAPAQPLLNDVLDQTRKYGNDPGMFTPTFSDWTKQGVAGLGELGQNPLFQEGVWKNLADSTGAGFGVGHDQLMKTASGGMLTGNPHLDKLLAASKQGAADTVNSQFSGAGRFGSGAHTGVLAKELGDIETKARYGDYATERQNQINAAGALHGAGMKSGDFAGMVDQSRAGQMDNLLKAGGMEDAMEAAKRMAPLQATEWMGKMGAPIAGLGGTSSGTSTTSTPANIPGMIGGGIMAGAGVLSGNPMMAMGGLSSLAGGLGGGGGSSLMASGTPPGKFQGQPMFGAIGGLNRPIMSMPGTPANGGWSTAATPAGWFY